MSRLILAVLLLVAGASPLAALATTPTGTLIPLPSCTNRSVIPDGAGVPAAQQCLTQRLATIRILGYSAAYLRSLALHPVARVVGRTCTVTGDLFDDTAYWGVGDRPLVLLDDSGHLRARTTTASSTGLYHAKVVMAPGQHRLRLWERTPGAPNNTLNPSVLCIRSR